MQTTVRDLADRGFSELHRWIPAQRLARLARQVALGLFGAIVLAQIALTISHLHRYDRLFIPYKETYVQLELMQREITSLIPAGSRMMSANPEFFINTSFSGVIFPYDSFDAILRYARQHKVDFVLTTVGDNIINQGLGFENLPPEEVERHITFLYQWQNRYFLFKVRETK